METVLSADVGTASHQHELEACTLYGRSAAQFQNDMNLQNLPASNQVIQPNFFS